MMDAVRAEATHAEEAVEAEAEAMDSVSQCPLRIAAAHQVVLWTPTE